MIPDGLMVKSFTMDLRRIWNSLIDSSKVKICIGMGKFQFQGICTHLGFRQAKICKMLTDWTLREA